jgi:hypothetical protein
MTDSRLPEACMTSFTWTVILCLLLPPAAFYFFAKAEAITHLVHLAVLLVAGHSGPVHLQRS